jgi:hypothetical protein
MIKTYQSISLKTKLISFILLLGIIFSITLQTWNINTALITTTVFAGIFASLHIILTFPRFTKITIISVIQLLFTAFISSTYGIIYATSDPISVSLALLTSAAILTLASVLNIYLNTAYGKGNKTLNLVVSLTILNLSGIVLAILTNIPLLLTLALTVILSTGYTILKSSLLKTRKTVINPVKQEIYNPEKLTTELSKITQKFGLTLTSTVKPNFWTTTINNKTYLITGMNLTDKLTITPKKQLLYKNLPYDNIIGELTTEALTLSHKMKLNKNTTQFIILDINNKTNLPETGQKMFNITTKTEKTNTLAQPIVSNRHGLTTVLKKETLTTV